MYIIAGPCSCTQAHKMHDCIISESSWTPWPVIFPTLGSGIRKTRGVRNPLCVKGETD